MTIIPGYEKTGNQQLQLVCLLIGRIAVNLLWGFLKKIKTHLFQYETLHAAEAISTSKKEWWNSVHDVIYTNLFHTFLWFLQPGKANLPMFSFPKRR